MPTIYHRRFLLSAFRSLNTFPINSGTAVEIDSIGYTLSTHGCVLKNGLSPQQEQVSLSPIGPSNRVTKNPGQSV